MDLENAEWAALVAPVLDGLLAPRICNSVVTHVHNAPAGLWQRA